MKAKWMAFLAIALLFPGCAGTKKPVIQKVGESVSIAEVEAFDLTNAKVQKLKGASGGKVVVLQDQDGKAEATIQLKKGRYMITVYAMGQSPDEDAFYVTIGDNQQQRMWPEEPGEILPTGQLVYFTQKADGPCDILLSFAESNVKLDCVEFKEVP